MIRRFIWTLALFVVALSIATSARAESDPAFTITAFDEDVVVAADSSVSITEQIKVVFSGQRHGIFRSLPYKYQDRSGNNLNLNYRVKSVTGGDDSALKYSTYKEGRNFVVKIGDPDQLVIGAQTYVIKYELDRVINFFTDHDELYFNITGNEWPVTISAVTAKIHLPQSVGESTNWRLAEFVGVIGSSAAPDCEGLAKGTLSCSRHQIIDGQTILFEARNLKPYEGLTVVAGWPKGIVKQPTFLTRTLVFLRDNWIFVLPVLAPIITLLVMLRIWKKYGQDPKAKGPIIPEFNPPDKLSPAELGTLADESSDVQDITGSIIDLANRGYLKIIAGEDEGLIKKANFEFVKLKDYQNDQTLKDYEKLILAALFASGDKVSKSDLEYKFYKHLAGIKNAIYGSLTKAGYFASDPDKVRKSYSGVGSFFVFGPVFFIFIFGWLGGWPILLASVLSGLVIMIVAKFMPKKTAKGAQALNQVKGFEMFMSTAETYRQKFNEDKNIFTRLLPYAIALGIVSRWSDAFKGLSYDKPGWYESNAPFNALYFAHSMDTFSRDMGSAITSTPRSSASSGGSGFSGGSSGGGFGGGGGGSW